MSPLWGFALVSISQSTGLHPWLQHAVPSGLSAKTAIVDQPTNQIASQRVIEHMGITTCILTFWVVKLNLQYVESNRFGSLEPSSKGSVKNV